MNSWHKFYGHSEVRVVLLNKLWFLLMPYYDPLLFAEQEAALPAVSKLLQTFAKSGLMYSDNDLRWRHVRQRDGKIRLIDLGSLGN